MSEANNQLVLISGFSASGKSASLRNIKNQENWVYLNCEAGKALPIKNKFKNITITDPMHVHEYFRECIKNQDQIDGIVIDSLTFLMDMYESQYVLTSSNTMKAWGDFAQFFKTLMQELVPQFKKPIIFIAHVKDELDEKNMEIKTSVPIKGSIKGTGVESYFSTVVSTKKVSIKELESFNSDLLEISEEERELGWKHVFQTRITKATLGERIRSPMGRFNKSQTYMDNDALLPLDHLTNIYK